MGFFTITGIDGKMSKVIRNKQDTTIVVNTSNQVDLYPVTQKETIAVFKIGNLEVQGVESESQLAINPYHILTFELGEEVINEIQGAEQQGTIEAELYGVYEGTRRRFARLTKTFTLSVASTYETTDENGEPVVIEMKPVLHEGFYTYVSQDDILPDAPADLLVGGYSKAVFNFFEDKIETKFGARIEQINVHCDGIDYSTRDFAQPIVTEVIKGYRHVDYVPVNISVMDNRLNAAAISFNMPVYRYSRPVLSNMSAFRCDGAGNENDEGAFLMVQATESHTQLQGHNDCTITAEWGVRGQALSDPVEIPNNRATTIGNGRIMPTNSYTVTFTARDDVGNSNTVSLIVPTPGAVFDALNGGNGFAFGKMAEKEGFLDSAWDISSDGGVYAGAELQEDGSCTYKAYMNNEGDIYGESLEVKRGIYGDIAHFETDVSADVGDFATAVTSDLGEFNRINLTTSLDGSEAAGRFKQLTVSDQMVSNAEIEANGGIAGVTNYPAMQAGAVYPPTNNDEEVYEREELTGGTWIDGKPIYRYTWMGVSSRSGSQGSYGNIPGGNPETVIRLYGTFKRPSDNAWFAIPNIYYGSLNYAVNLRTNAEGGFTVGFGSAYDGTKSMILVVEYTKK